MDFHSLIDNITNPALLFFILGVIAVQVKSDLKIPDNTSKFLSIYLMLSIGFKGGQELAHHGFDQEIALSLLLGIFLASIIPFVAYFVLKRKMSNQNSGAIAAAYGSVSAVTFVTAISFLDMEQVSFDGHMVAVMAAMEAPAIIVGVLLMNLYKEKNDTMEESIKDTVIHSVTNGSVLLIIGSLVIGFLASEKQAEGIAPFTTDIFKGFLAVFLLDKGLTTGKQISAVFKNGVFPILFALLAPFAQGLFALVLAIQVTDSIGNQLLLTILGASASYIAVPAAMKLAAPKANPSLYLPMALGITFPVNVMIGIPVYYMILQQIAG